MNSQDQIELLRGMALTHSITESFTDASPVHLRRWFVRTFVMDPFNRDLLATFDRVPNVLADLDRKLSWPSIEHAAIGTRLIWLIDPTSQGPVPSILNTSSWTNEMDVTNSLLFVHEPWRSLRYDPEGENWYSLVEPGQWHRHGKGNPSSNVVENWLSRRLDEMDLERNLDRFSRWPMNEDELARIGVDSATARSTLSINAFRKFLKAPTTLARVRKTLEQYRIMHLDVSTLNQIRQVTPFSNGALCLTLDIFEDTTGKQHVNHPGDLLTMDAEYMVTNANSIKWCDSEERIPYGVATLDGSDGGDWTYLDEYEDELLLQVPTYWSFLTHAFPEADERSAFLRLLGAAMFGSNIKIVAAIIGEPNAGKDTVINWLNYVMQGQVATLPFSAFTAQGDEDRGFAPLRGARVATVSGEVGEGRGSKLLAEKIKTVSSGGGKVRVAEKYEKPSDIYFDGMLWLQGNSVPTIQGSDVGFTNRLVAVEFKYPFPLQARSYETEYRDEASSFIQILFINYIRYIEWGGGMAGINPPESWRVFSKEFSDNANPHGFLEACITTSSVAVPTTQFHAAMSAMIAKFGSPYPVGPNYWPKRLRSMGLPTKGLHSVRKKVQRNGQPTWCYYLTLDADQSDGMFNQRDWENILRDAAVTA